MYAFGIVLMALYLLLAVGGFALIAWALLCAHEHLSARRERDLEELRRRYAGGELGEGEFQARRRQLAAR
jgi:uncharacterized membrane protein